MEEASHGFQLFGSMVTVFLLEHFQHFSPFSAEPFREGRMLNGSFNRQLCQGIYSELPGIALEPLCNGFSPAMP